MTWWPLFGEDLSWYFSTGLVSTAALIEAWPRMQLFSKEEPICHILKELLLPQKTEIHGQKQCLGWTHGALSVEIWWNLLAVLVHARPFHCKLFCSSLIRSIFVHSCFKKNHPLHSVPKAMKKFNHHRHLHEKAFPETSPEANWWAPCHYLYISILDINIHEYIFIYVQYIQCMYIYIYLIIHIISTVCVWLSYLYWIWLDLYICAQIIFYLSLFSWWHHVSFH